MSTIEPESAAVIDPLLDLNRSFWTDVAPKYDDVIDLVFGAEARRRVLTRLAKESGWGRVVEFGCGTGNNTQVLAEFASTVVATDLSPGMLARARARVRAGNVTFREENCQRPTFTNGSFDTAVLGLVLHFAEPAATLRPGGRLVIVNPGLESLGRLHQLGCQCRMIYYGITRYRQKPPEGFSKFLLSRRELIGLLGDLGFKSIQVEVIRKRPGGDLVYESTRWS
jgi:SAM-dependent methyltransferase